MTSVELYVYDLSRGAARSLSQSLLGVPIPGIWHSGVVVYGKEFSYGRDDSMLANNMANTANPISGIRTCNPGAIAAFGKPVQVHQLGLTEIPEEIVLEFLGELGSTNFKEDSYNLLEHNCNHFSNEFCMFLTGKEIPAYILSQSDAVANTPIGNTILAIASVMSSSRT